MTETRPAPEAGLLFIGTATTLISYGSLRILTDPNFLHRGERAYLGWGLTSRRLTEPALSVEQLPRLDAVVLSHLHGDHWDRRAHRGLDHRLPVITTRSAAGRLRARGFANAVGLQCWASTEITDADSRLTVTALPGRHAPGPMRHILPPVMGSLLEFGPLAGPVQLRLYLSGDTLLIDELAEIPRRFPQIDVAVLHLGGTTLPGGLLVTMDAQQGADALELIDGDLTVPVHFDDYTRFRSPLADFRAEVGRRGLTDRVRFLDRGDVLDLRPRRPGADARASGDG